MTIIPAVAASPRFTFADGVPTFPPTPSPKTSWQHAVAQADLPFHTKGILLIVATEWMNAEGASCHPTEEQIMAKAGVSRPCLTRHMNIAVEKGFIERWRWGHGNQNRRYNYRAILPGVPAPEVEMGNEVSYPTGEMGNEVSLHIPCSIVKHDQRAESAAVIQPAQIEPAPAIPLSQDSLRTIKTPPPDGIPESWLTWAIPFRADLPAEQIKTSIENFLDRNRAKGLRLVDWEAELRIWLRRERATKPTQTATTATQAPSRYAPLDQPKTAVQLAVEAALEQRIDERRIALCAQYGIDPATGLKIPPASPAPAPVAPAAPPILSQGPDSSYQARYARLLALDEARRAAQGGEGSDG